MLVPSEYVGGRLRERGIAADRVRVTPLAGLPLPVPAPTLPPEAVVQGLGIDGPYVVSVGTFEPRKNQARLVRAYRRAVTDGPPPPRAGAGGPSGVAHR